MNHHDAQSWRDSRKALFARPDPNRRYTSNGREFSLTHPKRCPICGDRFYTYGPADELPAPPAVDPIPDDDGKRTTCGHPTCWKVEDEEAAKRSSAATKAVAEVRARLEQDRRRAQAQADKNKPGASRGALAGIGSAAPPFPTT